MFRPLSLRCWTTQSIAAMTCETSVPPSAVRNLEAHDARIRCHAAVRGSGAAVWRVRRVAPGDQAGHERAVAERVEVGQVGRLGLEREVGPVDDLAGSIAAPRPGRRRSRSARRRRPCRYSRRPTTPGRPCTRSSMPWSRRRSPGRSRPRWTPEVADSRHEEGKRRGHARAATAGEVEAPAERSESIGPACRIWRSCLGSSKAVRSGCTIEVHLQEGLLMRRLATGRSWECRREDPWLCVPVSRRVCPVSDRILRQPTWLPTIRTMGPAPRWSPMGRKYRLVRPAHQPLRVVVAVVASGAESV